MQAAPRLRQQPHPEPARGVEKLAVSADPAPRELGLSVLLHAQLLQWQGVRRLQGPGVHGAGDDDPGANLDSRYNRRW